MMAAVESHNSSPDPPPPPPPPRQLPAVDRDIAASAAVEPPTAVPSSTDVDSFAPAAAAEVERLQQRQLTSTTSGRIGGHATTQLEFTQAMRDFKIMFPEMDDDVIEVVLRANQGAVDATIDQLLAMTTDNENERLRTEIDASENAEAPPGYPVTPPPTYQQAVPLTSMMMKSAVAVNKGQRPMISAVPTTTTTTAATTTTTTTSVENEPIPLRVVKNWCPPLLGPLPMDFLRIAGGQLETSIINRSRGHRTVRCEHQQFGSDSVVMPSAVAVLTTATATTTLCTEVIQRKIEENERRRRLSAASGDDDPDLTRCLEDERIALFLQNEEFMSELRANHDFLSTLERENSDSDTERPADNSTAAAAAAAAKSNADESEAVFREKLTNMGKKSKRKFAQLARLFSRQKKRGAKQMHYPYARLSDGGVGSMPSRDHLLLEDNDDEQADESDDDDAAAAGRPQNEYHSFKNSSSPSLQRCNSGAT